MESLPHRSKLPARDPDLHLLLADARLHDLQCLPLRRCPGRGLRGLLHVPLELQRQRRVIWPRWTLQVIHVDIIHIHPSIHPYPFKLRCCPCPILSGCQHQAISNTSSPCISVGTPRHISLLILCDGNPPVTSEFPSQRANYKKRWLILAWTSFWSNARVSDGARTLIRR